MKKRIFSSIVAVALASIVVSCTSKEVKNEVTTKADNESTTLVPGEIAEKGRKAIMESKSLSNDQKEKMMTLMNKTHADILFLKQETGKLKAVLFKDLMSGKSTKAEIKEIKKRISALEQQKMDLMFNSLDEAQKIIGKTEASMQEFQNFMELHYDRY